MKKKRLAFVDYWSHKSTKSGDFLREILSEKFEIVDFWWKEKDTIPINDLKRFDYLFFFHVMFPYQIMKKLDHKKIMWAPMYDGLTFRNIFFRSIFWKQISNLGIKVLKFSNKITESISNEKIETLKLNYYLKPEISLSKRDNKLNIFFWDRGRININDWIKFFNKDDINEILCFPKPDPGKEIDKKIYEDICKKYNLKLIEKKFMPKNEFIKILEKYNVFIAPRKKEGIGMSIVEAISKGIFIVGYNDSTMNEYISNDKIGFIFNESTSSKILTKDIIENYEYRKKNAEVNYKTWEENKEKIIQLLEKEPTNIYKIHFTPLFFIDDIKFLIKKIFKINFYYY